ETVTNVALDLGYDSPSAFTAMFRRILGASPRDYLRTTAEGGRAVGGGNERYADGACADVESRRRRCL
ncbi:helix-turn-helix domain-containing protein, partial [Tistrella sp.]|uniref:helix-turn-helix domain-containing protein n=1 Tax=Tistrella sp. TaxID=2024861 RepID=UPI000C9949DB